jgi:arylsulfatase A-like enzyme
LAGETDSGYAMLLTDLADRGLLDDTLVVWMGEFCRTPKYEDDQGGRNHYSEGWLVGLSGGGIKMGQVIGATDKDNIHVTDRPISVPDLFVTFCKVLGMDPHEEYFTEQNQPIKLVEGGTVIHELF